MEFSEVIRPWDPLVQLGASPRNSKSRHKTIRCKQCLLSEAAGAELGNSGICSLCRNFSTAEAEKREKRRKKYELDLETTLKEGRGNGQYDCIAMFSGGKDSIYMLYKLKVEYGLKVLALTFEQGLSEIARTNIRRTLKKLELDHIQYNPSEEFYKKCFKFYLRNQDADGALRTFERFIGPLHEGLALQLAVQKEIPLVFAGYAPGQPFWFEYEETPELIAKRNWQPSRLIESGLLNETEVHYFWNPDQYPQSKSLPRLLSPWHAWPYHQAQLMEEIVKLGLVDSAKSASPIFSNSDFHWLVMYSDLKKFGFNPFEHEFCRLIREGKANLKVWRRLLPIINFMVLKRIFLGRRVTRTCKWLDFPLNNLNQV